MKRLILIIVVMACIFMGSSCKKWLDITPKSQVAADDLFTSEEGFEEALNGVYIRCAQSDLYGDELTCGLPDVMAQNFTLSTSIDPKKYLPTQKFNFNDANFISRRDNIWGGLYNAIVNVNLILENIDAKEDIFTQQNYALIKGEALGLRAFLHFDLFRLFGSSFAGMGKQTGIPYVTTYSNKVTKTFSAQEVMVALEKDLSDAKALLEKADPIKTAAYIVDYPASDSSTENKDPSLFMQNRRTRLNYYAVTAELARVYLYEGKMDLALKSALEVIDAGKFPWTKQSDLISSDYKTKDLLLYKEVIFGWNAPWEADTLKRRFESGTGGMYITQDAAKNIYEFSGVGADDLRYKYWFQIGIDGNMEFEKYARNPDGTPGDPTSNLYPQTLPAIRLSEMYYIAAEAAYGSDPAKALAYIDDVRVNRGIGVKIDAGGKTAFLTELLKEARKEFYGEGQIFYMYKRLGRDIVGQSGMTIPASDKIFILPLPSNEIEFGNR